MKKYFFLFLSAAVLTACNNNTEEKAETKDGEELLSTDLVTNPHSAEGVDSVAFADMPVMEFKDTTYNFGDIREGEQVSHEFEFTNTGKTPLIISNATGSCGCTVPQYPREPIAPGKSGKMIVNFNSADKQGHQEKSVTITTNSQRGMHMLYIKADVATANK